MRLKFDKKNISAGLVRLRAGMARKKWITAAVCSVVGIGLLGKVALATDMLSVQVNIPPFHWTIGSSTYSNAVPYFNGDKDVPTSLNYEGTTYVPIRLLAEQLGLSVEWDNDTQTATLLNGGAGLADDPVSDLSAPGKSSGYHVYANMVTNDVMRDQASGTGTVLSSLAAGVKVEVLDEQGGWLKVRLTDKTGFLQTSSTDYVPESKRPAWEQKADSIIKLGLGRLGTPYQYGAPLGQTDTFDCSSFMNYLFGQNGIKLPRDSRQQSQVGTEVPLNQLRKGDLLFFTTPARKDKTGLEHIGHVALYLGNNQVLHTYRVGIGVTVTDLDSRWDARMVKAMRVLN